jgi:hypothetical protein
MNLEVIENRLLGLDDEIHRILQYISKQKESDIGNDITTDIEDYENIKTLISRRLKKPLDPTSELRKLRDKQYLV